MDERSYRYSRIWGDRLGESAGYMMGILLIIAVVIFIVTQGLDLTYVPGMLLFLGGAVLSFVRSIYTLTPDLKVVPDGLMVKIAWRCRLIPWTDIAVYTKWYGFAVITPHLPWMYSEHFSRYAIEGDRGFIIGKYLEGADQLEYEFFEHGVLDKPSPIRLMW